MSEETEVLETGKSPEQSSAPLTWAEAWIMALTRPSVATFERIARDPDASSRRGYIWIFIAYFIGDLLSITFEAVKDKESVGFNCFLPISAFVAVANAFIILHVTQWIAKKLGGTGAYPQLVYAFAAALAPIALLSTAIGFIPFVQFVVIPLYIYGVMLYVLAVRAVHQLGGKKAIVSTLTPLLVEAALSLVVIAGLFGGILLMENLSGANEYYGEDYDTLVQALNKRWENDKTLPTTSVGFGANDPQQYRGHWLMIEMSYTGTCTPTETDPCDQLADEFAQIVFDSYRKVDDLDGIGVVIGDKPHYLSVEPADIQFQKYLTVAEWREELSLEK